MRHRRLARRRDVPGRSPDRDGEAVRQRPARVAREVVDPRRRGRRLPVEDRLCELPASQVTVSRATHLRLGEPQGAGRRQLVDVGEDRLRQPDHLVGGNPRRDGGLGEVHPGAPGADPVCREQRLEGPSVVVLPRPERAVELGDRRVEGVDLLPEEAEETLQRPHDPATQVDPVRAGEVLSHARQHLVDVLEGVLDEGREGGPQRRRDRRVDRRPRTATSLVCHHVPKRTPEVPSTGPIVRGARARGWR